MTTETTKATTDEKPKRETPRWICSVVFLKDGKYPLPPITHTYAAWQPHVAAAKAIAGARREAMKGKHVDHVTVKVVRAAAVKEG